MVRRPVAPPVAPASMVRDLPIRWRRQKAPDVDQEHFEFLLANCVREVGLSHAFILGEYANMRKTYAVRGSTLVLVCM